MSSVASGMNEADNTDPSERFLCLYEIVEAVEQALSTDAFSAFPLIGAVKSQF